MTRQEEFRTRFSPHLPSAVLELLVAQVVTGLCSWQGAWNMATVIQVMLEKNRLG